MAKRERDALASAHARLRLLADYALTPSAARVAREGAAICLWGLSIDEYDGIEAAAPEGETIYLTIEKALRALPTTEEGA